MAEIELISKFGPCLAILYMMWRDSRNNKEMLKTLTELQTSFKDIGKRVERIEEDLEIK